MPTILFTGFPGFLGSELLPRVLKRHPARVTADCLIQAKFRAAAEKRKSEIERAEPSLEGRIRLVEGDITRPELGLAAAAASALAGETIEIYHLAAVYDLAVKRDLAMRVNVDGTRHTLDFAAACRGLTRFQYVSTCYVSGRTAGVFTERDLERGQSFNNYYEETKYLAEVEVRRRAKAGLPVTVYRPSIVVGDSRTGATQKYDGPYFVLQWLLRQPRVAIMPMVGDPERTCVNVAPRDFVVEALAHLSGIPKSTGKTYHLCDPRPLDVKRMTTAMARATGRKIIFVHLPLSVAKAAIRRVPGVYRLMRIPAEAIDYFVHPTHYTCENTLEDLEGSGIECPPFEGYLPRLIQYMKAHPEIGSGAMV
jgi:thioester reductase-like protein